MSKAKGSSSAEVRIIAGQWRGRRLPVLSHQGLRPTKDAVRETLFNWLAPYLQGALCIDFFAGTGALGLEAASRGASRVVLVERDAQVARQLQQNVGLLQASSVVVENQAAERQFENLMATEEVVDVVFFDPPFDLVESLELLRRLLESKLLSTEAQVYIEQDKQAGLPELPLGWAYRREKKMGNVVYGVACKA